LQVPDTMTEPDGNGGSADKPALAVRSGQGFTHAPEQGHHNTPVYEFDRSGLMITFHANPEHLKKALGGKKFGDSSEKSSGIVRRKLSITSVRIHVLPFLNLRRSLECPPVELRSRLLL
jgi:hypothetical protein